MLIEKPRCNFKNCKYCFDGNCFSADKYENCKVTDLHSEIAKLTVDLDNAKSEVAREIFADLDETLDNITMIISNPAEDNFISVFRKTMEKVTAGVEGLKKKYTEEKE